MKHKRLILLIGSMSIAMSGLIAIQFLWIKQAYDVKQQQFQSAVSAALRKTIEKLDRDEQIVFITQSFDDQQFWTDSIEHKNKPGLNYFATEKIDSFISEKFEKLKFNIPVFDSTIIITDFSEHKPVYLKDRTIKLDSQKAKIHVLKDEVDSVNRILQIKLQQKSNQLKTTINRMAYEFNLNKKNLHHRLKPEELNEKLKTELKQAGVQSPYQYAVFMHDSVAPVYKSSNFKPEKQQNVFRTLLFPNDIIGKSDYLEISFPHSSPQILLSMIVPLTASGLFTICIVIIFIYSLLIIVRQKKIDDIKTDFINNMTHEFKTPLATISLASDAILNPEVIQSENQVRSFIQIIKEENKRMGRQVEKILEAALIDKHELELKPAIINIHSLLNTCTERFNLQCIEKNAVMEKEFQAMNFHIMADEIHFGNALSNLIDNALKYTGNNPRIDIRTRNIKNMLYIEIEDNGPGISKEAQTHIFDKFYRIPTGNIHNVKGFGLGLSYAKAIVDQSGGEIKLRSQEGKGSVFTIIIPCHE